MYDPNSEATNEKMAVAGHWELLRRNRAFQELSEHWSKSDDFRRLHAMSSDYHNLRVHTPRCALDWMLTTEQRVALAKFQIDKLRWMVDSRFNFGPFVCHESFSRAALTRENFRECYCLELLPDAPAPLRIDQPWNTTPEIFKREFFVAYDPSNRLTRVNEKLEEISKMLRIAGAKLANGDKLKEMSIIGDILFDTGTKLHDMAELGHIYKLPRRRFSEKQLNEQLERIRKDFKDSNLLIPTATYDTHKSYQGTTEDWRWFLEAEDRRLNIQNPPELWKLSELYCEVLRERALHGKAPPRAQTHGFTGSKFPSKVIKNRRRTVERHVLTIEGWIRRAYPPQAFGADTKLS
jgi:hypothetical protein